MLRGTHGLFCLTGQRYLLQSLQVGKQVAYFFVGQIGEDACRHHGDGRYFARLDLGLRDRDGLLSVGNSEFTAGYDIETKFNSVSSTGLVVQAAGQRRSITIDNSARSVRFIVDGNDERTCDLLTAECEASLNDARISDTQLPHTFYGPAFAQRLRADAVRRTGDPTAYEKSVAGQIAQCVDIAVAGGTKTYCALASGALAEFVGADVTIELTSYSVEPDTTKLANR